MGRYREKNLKYFGGYRPISHHAVFKRLFVQRPCLQNSGVLTIPCLSFPPLILITVKDRRKMPVPTGGRAHTGQPLSLKENTHRQLAQQIFSESLSPALKPRGLFKTARSPSRGTEAVGKSSSSKQMHRYAIREP